MERTEKNKLILEFMGEFDKISSWRGSYSWSDGPFFTANHPTREEVVQSACEYAPYDSDWRWLMPVVEKIESTTSISIIISCGNCEAFDTDSQEPMFWEETNKLQSTYEVCVKVIQKILNK